MRSSTRTAAAAAPRLIALLPAPPAPARAGGVVADLVKGVPQAEQKLVGPAKAMPESTWAWRPGAGVRTVGEVFEHVAADNYFLPTRQGFWILATTHLHEHLGQAVAYARSNGVVPPW